MSRTGIDLIEFSWTRITANCSPMEALTLGSRNSPCILSYSTSKAWGVSLAHMLQTSQNLTLGPSLRQKRHHLPGPHRHRTNRRRYTSVKPLRRDQSRQGVVFVSPKPSHTGSRMMSIRSVYELGPDDSGENIDEAALYRRTVYDHDAWKHHVSSLRHAKTILSMPGSKVVLALAPPVFVLTLEAAALALYNDLRASPWLPSWFPLLHVSPLPFQLLAPALALLLVFRTNASYARFDEARKAWGSNVSRTRDVARQALSWIQHPSDAERVKKLLRHCIAYNFCLKNHMLREGSLKRDLTFLLEEDELEVVLAASHQPNFCLMIISEIIHVCNISDMEQALMSKNITQFFDNLGTCERIFKTPIPLSYTRLTSRLLVIWHVALPLALWDQCKWASVPATALSAAVLFCIEEVGVLIEEPFQIFPLEILCTLASENVDALMHIHEELVLDGNKHPNVDEDRGQEKR